MIVLSEKTEDTLLSYYRTTKERDHFLGYLIGTCKDSEVFFIEDIKYSSTKFSHHTKETGKLIKPANFIGYFFSSKEKERKIEILSKRNKKDFLFATYESEEDKIEFFLRNKGKIVLLEKIVLRFKADLFSRIEGIFETDVLADKKVTIIGLGTGGSLGAVELAKCGVSRFDLVDFDRLELHNIARHACGISDVGRLKTKAVRDLILEKNPYAQIETFDFNVMDDPVLLRQIITDSDLVFVATDTEASKFRINAVCLEEKVPAIYGGVYERAFGGDVIRVIPGETPCYDCVMGTLGKTFEDLPRQSVIDYSSVTDSTDFKAEPGLSIDVNFLVLIQAKMAILTLLRGTDSRLEDFRYNFVLWGNKSEWIFKQPLQCRFAKIDIREDCVTCQRGRYWEKALGMTKKEIERDYEKIISKIKSKK